MEAYVYEYKKMVDYDRKGQSTWNKSTLFFDNYLKHPPLKVGSLNRQLHKKEPLMFGIKLESGIALVNLRESIKSKLDYFNHSMMISESVDHVKMEIFNNTKSDVIVRKGESLYFVNFINQ